MKIFKALNGPKNIEPKSNILIKDTKGYIYYSQPIDYLPPGTYLLSVVHGDKQITKRIEIT
ncbi:MAG: hypothetical protein V3V14_09845 [Saprospiraceae bacterium]